MLVSAIPSKLVKFKESQGALLEFPLGYDQGIARAAYRAALEQEARRGLTTEMFDMRWFHPTHKNLLREFKGLQPADGCSFFPVRPCK